ncbi:hypothetical protein C8R47DRAFT_139689 [Mycena vitilis]|nr:hypothetical protein C8R47DRAFT_139689 [Mycena vitilis]
MQLGQFSASITVDGVPLSEYAVECSADGTEATCWIASETDKKFSIMFKDIDASPQRPVNAKASIDGIKCGGGIYLEDPSGSGVARACRRTVAASANTRRPLLFSKQVLTDDDAYLNATISPDLGTIKVLFVHVKLRPDAKNARKKPREYHEPANILHERSKKAMGHSVQFGPEFHRDRSAREHLHPQAIKTLATLTFKYRPIELLRAQGIAPPLVREERATLSSDILDLTMDVDDSEEEGEDSEITKLEIRLDALKKNKKNKQVKRESSGVKQEIKQEDLKFTPGEVIDLT